MDDLVNERREFKGLSLVIFDIDDTLLHTTAKINVVRDGQVIRSLTNQEFNNYQLQPGEEFDFGEFRNAEKFAQESKPIKPMINKLKTILAHADQTQSKVIMLTARADFDDKHTVLKTFHDYGIDMSRIHLYRAGNIPGDNPPALKKAVYVRKFLSSGEYDRVSLYDDSTSNLKAFKALKKEFPHVRFSAYHVSPSGHATQVETAINEKVGDVVQIVEPGDTVYSIARQNNLDPVELMKFNKFNNTTRLSPGQQVRIPNRSKANQPTTNRIPAKAVPTKLPAKAVPNKPQQPQQPQPLTKNPIELTLRDYAIQKGITGKELAQFMAQCAHESASFTLTLEIASGANYEGNVVDLGNTQPGDGIRYKGRGYIQLTGRRNYTDAGRDLKLPLVEKPELVEQPAIAIKTSVWYWLNRVKPAVADATNSRQVTRIINGGYTHLKKRIKWFKNYLSTMVKKPFKEDVDTGTSNEPELMKVFKDFFPLAMAMLKIDKLPPIKFKHRIEGDQPSFGGFDMSSGIIYLQIENRHPLDIIRTLAHELVHFRQQQNNKLPPDGGKSGSPYENQANQLAGIIMRRFNQKFPHYFDSPAFKIQEDQSDYEIRNYKKLDSILMSLCKMVIKGQQSEKDYGMVAACVLDPDNQIVARLNYPGTKGKRVHAERAAIEAYQSKYGLIPEGSIILTTLSPCNEHMDERDGPSCTDVINQSGVKKVYCGYIDPSQHDEHRDYNLMETSDLKLRNVCKKFADTFLDDVEEDYDPNGIPPGPEFKPTMPAGTVRVDVSDVYDWYKLGKHMPNLAQATARDFGKGPPSTIVSFGSEPEEHKYIKNLKKLGLDTTDIDPIDLKQPKNMPRQKTDPTYNVGENFADGKNPGRKGLAKRSGINTKASVSTLRNVAKHSSGEKARMAHWLANMKAGKKK